MLLGRNKLSLRRRRKPPLCVSAADATRPEGAGKLARENHAEFPQLAAVSQAPGLDQKDNSGNNAAASSTRVLTTFSFTLMLLLFHTTSQHLRESSWLHVT